MNELIVTLKRAGWRATYAALSSAPIVAILDNVPAVKIEGENVVGFIDSGHLYASAAVVGMAALSEGLKPIVVYVRRNAFPGSNGHNYNP